MGLLLLIPGLILDLAGSSWFSGAHKVGVILIIVGAILTIVQILFMWAMVHWISK